MEGLLEPCAWQLARTDLRGLGRRKAPWLPDKSNVGQRKPLSQLNLGEIQGIFPYGEMRLEVSHLTFCLSGTDLLYESVSVLFM